MDDCLPFKKNDPVSGLKDSQLAITLTALRHDHPMITYESAAVQHMHMMRDRKLAPVTFDSAVPSPSDHFRSDFEAAHSCLPYGYYYDTEDMIDVEDSFLYKSQAMDLEDWIMEDFSSAAIDDDYCYLKGRMHFKQTKDSGPTLAQLNLTDNLDVEELLSSSPIFMTNATAKRKNHSTTQPHYHHKDHPKHHISERQVHRTLQVISRNAVTAKPQHTQAVSVEHVADAITNVSSRQQTQESSTQVFSTNEKGVSEETEPDTFNCSMPAPETAVVPQKSTAGDREPGHVTSKPHDLPAGVIDSGDLNTGRDVITPRITSARGEGSGEKAVASSSISPSKSQSPRARNSSMCTEGSISSHDEGFASQVEEDSEDDEEVEDSDDESFYGDYDATDLLGASTSDDLNNRWALNMGRSRKGGQQRFFWQYNVQSKGPKNTRIPSVASGTSDPHVLPEAKDPVFSPECRVEGVKHAGKARRGDGNDLTPNPKKLLMIGLELKKLSKTINDLTPVADVPVNARNKTRKEKNKLASRACRLKKKAQHEANKIKLFGLQQEHRKTMQILKDIRKMVRQNFESRSRGPKPRYSTCIEQAIAQQGDFTLVAGRTSDFVNSVSYPNPDHEDVLNT